MTGLRIREAARVIVLDDAERVLLVRFDLLEGGRLAALIRQLVPDGSPPEPIDVGV